MAHASSGCALNPTPLIPSPTLSACRMAETAHLQGEWDTALWYHFGAAVDMLENAIVACPDELWGDRAQQPEFWYMAYHTLFFLDYYLSESADGFQPPAPFTLEELDPAGVLPERVFTKDELLRYLEHGREKCRRLIASLTDETAREVRRFNGNDWTVLEWLLDSMRHVQHHTAQLNLILRQQTDSAPRWVGRTSRELELPHRISSRIQTVF